MHGARKDHGIWDINLEHMLEMEAAVEKDQCLGASSLDWSKFFSLERDTANNLVQHMLWGMFKPKEPSGKQCKHRARQEETTSCKVHATASKLL